LRFPASCRFTVIAAVGVGLIISVHAATVVPITEVYAHNEYWNFTQGEDDMINGSGMTYDPGTGPVTISEAGNAGWPTIGGDPSGWTTTSTQYQSEWQSGKLLTGATHSKIGWAAFDLGSITTGLDELYIWHIRENTGRVAATYNVYVATTPTVALGHGPDNTSSAIDYNFSSGGWTLVTGGTGTYRGSSVIDLGEVSARYIGIEILTNTGDANRVGFAEIAVTAVPEPRAALLGGLGLLGLLRRRR
jgi:hypothetical protein